MTLITICINATAEKARTTAEEAEANVLILLDSNGRVASTYRVSGTPTIELR